MWEPNVEMWILEANWEDRLLVTAVFVMGEGTSGYQCLIFLSLKLLEFQHVGNVRVLNISKLSLSSILQHEFLVVFVLDVTER